MVRIRPARPADAVPITEAHVAAIEAFGPEAYDDEEVAAWAKRDERDSSIDGLDDPDVYVVTAERDGEVAGFGRLHLDDAEVIAVYVHPDHARAGVGSALLASLEGYARGAGLSALSLVASLNAVDFYERAGYERVQAVSHETSAGVELDCVEMRKEL
jgi:putative acetyltransferase